MRTSSTRRRCARPRRPPRRSSSSASSPTSRGPTSTWRARWPTSASPMRRRAARAGASGCSSRSCAPPPESPGAPAGEERVQVAREPLRLVAQLPPRDPDGGVARRGEDAIALAVALEGEGREVGLAAAELDDDLLRVPQGVDLLAEDRRVALRSPQAEVFDEAAEALLELPAGGLDVDGVPQRSADGLGAAAAWISFEQVAEGE